MIRLAVIGLGRWGPNHIRNFGGLPDAEVVLCVDTQKEALARLKPVFPTLKTSSEVKDAFGDPSIQAVVIATPTSTHYKLAHAALTAGKHVLCEKPLCETSKEADELTALAEEKKLILMVGHVFLFNAGIVRLKEFVDSGDLGKLYYLSAARTNLGPIRSDVNVAMDLASHDISIMNWLLGRAPERVTATGGAYLRPGVEDVSFISLTYPGNVHANIHVSWLDPAKVRRMTIVGSKRMATWDDLQLTSPVAIYDKGADVDSEYRDYAEFLRVKMWDGDVRLPKISVEEPLRLQSQGFLKAIREGKPDRCGGVFAGEDIKVLEAVNASMKAGGSSVAVAP
jgi:predicted dehydrogenase